jgi:two-component sensor histidine kinase
MYFVPLNPKDYLSLRQFLIITDLWTFPYITMAYIFLYKSLVSGNQRFEADRPLTIITIVGISAIYVIAVYLLPFYHFSIFKLNPHLVIIFLGLFSFLALKYGFLGFKLSVRNLYIDNAIKTVDSEVSVLNCHIKDKIVQINACARDIEAAIGDDRNLIVKKAETILAVTGQVSSVAEQLHHYLDRIHLDPIRQNIVEVVKQAIALFEPQIKEKELRIANKLPRDLIIQVDRFYLSEVLKKILQNSMEAMATGGSIIIDVARSKRNMILIINDNGCGISSKDLPHILKPFYTTKDPSSHFGLGLPYCYNIMRQHGGMLEIESVENNGTTVFLNFPVKNISS